MNKRSGQTDGRVSIRDIARMAEVSTSTVSHVINESRFVAPEKRERILKIIEDVGYRPNIQAQSLKGRQTKTLGLIVSDLEGSFFYRFVNTVGSCSQESEYDIIVCNSEGSLVKERRHIDMLLRKGVDGFIYAPVDHRTYYEELDKAQVPTVQIERQNHNYNADYVGIQDEYEAARITEHFLSEGARRISFLMYGGLKYLGRRYHGFQRVAEAHGIFDPDLVKRLDFEENPSPHEFRAWLDRHRPVDAIMCSSLKLSLFVLNSIGTDHFTETKIFSFDDDPWLDHINRRISSLHQPIEEIAKIAVTRLIERVEGNEDPPEEFRLSCDIVTR